jgi:hypothetical protein
VTTSNVITPFDVITQQQHAKVLNDSNRFNHGFNQGAYIISALDSTFRGGIKKSGLKEWA